ncbi:alcohol dehydrogenase catalytic domain-containing protein [Saccharopolyspora sp. TS4A08]|uniref:Alcohol dehydrogenase catalytic domain-containing protein n=1 Tax=Saccharopolyspora ipomoeae TaxID=3042027 RepID=A0ABT6PR77_9PSEU|nr:alcohol dehydrogenase catalytic domain-containing protein [Saccharopolyspora sp. TS4A08]MDI2030512.1 alcohol dehydrogenase catalytic domain-containing protein [Saccharopolyspora sp. TS4A08]
MRAYRMFTDGSSGLTEVPSPVPTAGQVRLEVLAAGLCQSDLHVIDTTGVGPATTWPTPYTLGHETCGRVAELGPGTTGVHVGDQVIVHSPWGCGQCARCTAGRPNYCDRPDPGAAGIGLGVNGGLADEMVVEAGRLVPADGLDPALAATLADAGLTSYHAISGCRDALAEPDAIALVIGVGGLGHLAISVLTATSHARVIAVDVRGDARDLALACGAAIACAPDEVHGALHPRHADVVLDFVGSDATMALAARSLRRSGEIVVIGSAGGTLPVAKGAALPPGARVRLPFWGSRDELTEVVALAREHDLRAETTTYPLDDADEALDDLRHGRVLGRAVVLPQHSPKP